MSSFASSGTARHDDVGDLQPPARLEHAVGLGQHGRLVRAEIDDAVGDHDVCHRVRNGELFEKTPPGTRRCPARAAGIAARLVQHRRRHIDADHPARRTPPSRRQKRVESRTGNQDRPPSRPARDRPRRRDCRPPRSSPRQNRAGIDPVRRVAEPLGQKAAGVKVESLMRTGRDLGVFVLDGRPEQIGVEQRWWRSWRSLPGEQAQAPREPSTSSTRRYRPRIMSNTLV